MVAISVQINGRLNCGIYYDRARHVYERHGWDSIGIDVYRLEHRACFKEARIKRSDLSMMMFLVVIILYEENMKDA